MKHFFFITALYTALLFIFLPLIYARNDRTGLGGGDSTAPPNGVIAYADTKGVESDRHGVRQDTIPVGVQKAPETPPIIKPLTNGNLPNILPRRVPYNVLSDTPARTPDDHTVDMQRLAIAVARQETNHCHAKTGSSLVNNCFGIMEYSTGKRKFKKYKHPDESYADFIRLWKAYYGGLPTLKQAKRYSGGDRSDIWLRNVLFFYHNS